MSGLLGASISKNDGSGVTGTIVSARLAGGVRSGSGTAYDIVWSDQTCSTKVLPQMITASNWIIQGARLNPAECNRIWVDFQVQRARQLEREHVQNPRQSAPIEVDRQLRMRVQAMGILRRAVEVRAEALAKPAQPLNRPASAVVRFVLDEALPGVQFAISVERKKLTVGWIDGPVQESVLKALKPLEEQGTIEKISIRRGINESFVQAAIDLVLRRVWTGREADGAKADRLRITPDDYLSGSMGTVMTPASRPVGVVPYGHLIRCVIDRWDCVQERFVDTDRTRYLVQELKCLFPQGNLPASQEFHALLSEAVSKTEAARDYVGSLPMMERERG
jgi:hypothetical protein